MDKVIAKFVSQEFLSEKQGEILEENLMQGCSLVISGHRSAGIRPFLANMMMFFKQKFNAVKVGSIEDVAKEAEALMIPGIDDIDFEALILEAMKKDCPMVTIKEPEHPYSIMKLLKKIYKSDGQFGKKYLLLDCDKEDGVPYVERMTLVSVSQDGKITKDVLA